MQVKKDGVRKAILDAAYALFKEQGYSETRMPVIAKRAGTSPGNIYVYFPSKLDLLVTIYADWFRRRVQALGKSVQQLDSPEDRLKKILTTVWRDWPAYDNGFGNNLIQALSTATSKDEYSPALRLSIQDAIAKLLQDCLPQYDAEQNNAIATFLMMAFDGYVVNYHLTARKLASPGQVEFLASVLLNGGGAKPKLPA